MAEIENEKWYALYKAAMMEFEHSLVAGRIKDRGKTWEVNWITDQTRVKDESVKAH
jgi:hypothetical protein